MIRLTAAVVGGVIIGVVAMLASAKFGSSSTATQDEIVRDIVAVPTMTENAANAHRNERYASLNSVEEILALPSDFARSEALHVLAGRSDSAGVQELIFETNRIADDIERVEFLGILFFRLSETDPQSALALARTDHFDRPKGLEKIIWRTWARKDLDDALFAAKAQTSRRDQNSAAQSLYAAFGNMGNTITDRIEAELGIAPNSSNRSKYLYRLADSSPADAIAFINALQPDSEHRQYVSLLANYIGTDSPAAALAYVDLFEVASDGKYFGDIINNKIARDNPRAVIDRLLAGGRRLGGSGQFHIAAQELAKTDIDAARQYYDAARSMEDRRIFGSVIAKELAKTDPAEALTWARANDQGPYPYMQMSVLGELAKTDPQLALEEVLNSPQSQMRSVLVSTVVQRIAKDNPSNAVVYLDQIQDSQDKLAAGQQIVSAWIRLDPDAAIDWVLSQDQQTANPMMRMVSSRLLDADIDTAIRVLPRLDEEVQTSMRQQIAMRLATRRSPADAQNFIRQFEGQPDYIALQASVISGMARTDVLMAKQMADQLVEGIARDRAYVQVIAQRAETDPAEAVQWLSQISDDSQRGMAAGQVASHWYNTDPAAATHWVSNLPAGPSRDDAIMYMSSQWRTPGTEQQDLIASIGDRNKRGQAKIRQAYVVMRTDPARARRLLEDEDIPSNMRQEVELMINQAKMGF